jgi:dUTP pyrophosphatase
MENDVPQVKKRKMSPEAQNEAPLAPVANLLIKRLSEKAKLPTRGSPLSAGYDLYRCVNVTTGTGAVHQWNV